MGGNYFPGAISDLKVKPLKLLNIQLQILKFKSIKKICFTFFFQVNLRKQEVGNINISCDNAKVIIIDLEGYRDIPMEYKIFLPCKIMSEVADLHKKEEKIGNQLKGIEQTWIL